MSETADTRAGASPVPSPAPVASPTEPQASIDPQLPQTASGEESTPIPRAPKFELYLPQIPPYYNDHKLKKVLTRWGLTIKRIHKVPSWHYAFVQFDSKELMDRGLELLKGKELKGNPIDARSADAPRPILTGSERRKAKLRVAKDAVPQQPGAELPQKREAAGTAEPEVPEAETKRPRTEEEEAPSAGEEQPAPEPESGEADEAPQPAAAQPASRGGGRGGRGGGRGGGKPTGRKQRGGGEDPCGDGPVCGEAEGQAAQGAGKEPASAADVTAPYFKSAAPPPGFDPPHRFVVLPPPLVVAPFPDLRVPYAAQLQAKKRRVHDTMRKMCRLLQQDKEKLDWVPTDKGSLLCPFVDMLPSPRTEGYRNKARLWRRGENFVGSPEDVPIISPESKVLAGLLQEYLRAVVSPPPAEPAAPAPVPGSTTLRGMPAPRAAEPSPPTPPEGEQPRDAPAAGSGTPVESTMVATTTTPVESTIAAITPGESTITPVESTATTTAITPVMPTVPPVAPSASPAPVGPAPAYLSRMPPPPDPLPEDWVPLRVYSKNTFRGFYRELLVRQNRKGDDPPPLHYPPHLPVLVSVLLQIEPRFPAAQVDWEISRLRVLLTDVANERLAPLGARVRTALVEVRAAYALATLIWGTPRKPSGDGVGRRRWTSPGHAGDEVLPCKCPAALPPLLPHSGGAHFPGCSPSAADVYFAGLPGGMTGRVQLKPPSPSNAPAKPVVLAGEGFIWEDLCGLKFRVSTNSFFQVNTSGAEVLYGKVREWALDLPESASAAAPPPPAVQPPTADPTPAAAVAPTPVAPTPVVATPTPASVAPGILDVCCGTGTIGLCVGQTHSKIIGVDIEQSSIDDAKVNAAANGITKAQYLAGRAEDVMTAPVIASCGQPAVAIVDPPRCGLHTERIHAHLHMCMYRSRARIAARLRLGLVASGVDLWWPRVCVPFPFPDPNIIHALRRARGIERLVYVSCNPDSLAVDTANLCKLSYQRHRSPPFVVVKGLAVDMFPHTEHCEMVRPPPTACVPTSG
ncbi:putative S-adenosylmethionine-dependent methyltransferase [Paratrimastix pyriformis]|uniref:S-adenosylmethionine-dependent methyltransferase n=1 Tax=Paratrimastix pyriformis TaxID=342808 RepID=A0ABQ8UTB0_9EUKA|nr:putative S-adenosylmethionine-dependent methyltransferase [Paratrimastix pyriformis]